MPQADRCAEPGYRRLTVDQALARMLASVEPTSAAEWVPLKAARGRILAEDIAAPLDLPPFRSSAMDGYAIRREDLSAIGPLRLTGASLAGHSYAGTLAKGECIRIFTGAPMPDEADAVVAQEDVRRAGDQVYLTEPIASGNFVRPQGDDIQAGQRLLTAGKRLAPADLGLLATSGHSDVLVRCRLRAALISTGDELRATWSPLAEGEIHESNRYVLDALLADLGIESVDLGVVPDDPETLRDALLEASAHAEVIVTSGGASVGEADYLVAVLREIGHLEFWKVAVKPGKPFCFGRIGAAWLFGLPGNPAAALVSFRQLVQPALMRLMGAVPSEALRLRAVCTTRLIKAAGRLEFQRGVFHRNADGTFHVAGLGGQGSHRLSTLSQANCFIVLPLENAGVEPGTTVDIEPFAPAAWAERE